MKPAALLVLAGFCAACAAPAPATRSATGPPQAPARSVSPSTAPPVEEGATVEAAVLVPAGTEREGVAWENDWIFRHYGRFRKKGVALASQTSRRYDVVTVELADHSERVIYFDVTDFFGK